MTTLPLYVLEEMGEAQRVNTLAVHIFGSLLPRDPALAPLGDLLDLAQRSRAIALELLDLEEKTTTEDNEAPADKPTGNPIAVRIKVENMAEIDALVAKMNEAVGRLANPLLQDLAALAPDGEKASELDRLIARARHLLTGLGLRHQTRPGDCRVSFESHPNGWEATMNGYGGVGKTREEAMAKTIDKIVKALEDIVSESGGEAERARVLLEQIAGSKP